MRKMYSKNQINEMINNEVESALEDLTIEASNIDSGEATSGQVLTADGEGGASFQNVAKELPETLGTAGQVLKVNSGATGVEWANESGGTKIYKHYIELEYNDTNNNTTVETYLIIYSFDNTPIDILNFFTVLQSGNILAFLDENNGSMVMRLDPLTQEVSLYSNSLYGYSTIPASYELAYQFTPSDIITFSDNVTLK